jgi:hypothetical protein
MKSLDKTGNVLLFLMFLFGRTCPEISPRSSDRKRSAPKQKRNPDKGKNKEH